MGLRQVPRLSRIHGDFKIAAFARSQHSTTGRTNNEPRLAFSIWTPAEFLTFVWGFSPIIWIPYIISCVKDYVESKAELEVQKQRAELEKKSAEFRAKLIVNKITDERSNPFEEKLNDSRHWENLKKNAIQARSVPMTFLVTIPLIISGLAFWGFLTRLGFKYHFFVR